jgi:serine/threonine-protein kinase
VVDDGPRILAGRYEVGELIGRGGMAEVHIGHDRRLGRTVAIKILRSDLARDPSFQNRFRREAQAAAALNHPAIVAVYDTGEDVVTEPTGVVAHVPFIVMEYVEGHTVRDILKDGAAVPIEEAVEITAGVLSALEYSHHAGIVHRDIKPANVMLTPTGAVKVMDFGIARAIADSSATMTQTQAVIGTAQYLSPEQARGEQVDARSDLYSTGCLLFELLTGRPPFTGDSPVAVAYQHVREVPPVPSTLASDVPEVLDRITLKALAKERESRYQTAGEFRGDLEAFLHGGAVHAPAVGAVGAALAVPAAAEATQLMAPPPATTQVVAPASPPWSAVGVEPGVHPTDDDDETRRPWLIWLLIIVAVAAVGAIAFMLLKGGGGEETAMVTVPTVVGKSSEDAIAALKAEGLEPKLLEEASDSIEEGNATRTDPEEGEEVEKGSDVDLYISTGPSEVTVPDVAGRTEAEATKILTDAGLVVSPTRVPEDLPDQAQGLVIKTEPAADSEAKEGDEVVLHVSTGLVNLPDLSGMPQADAVAALNSLKLLQSITTEESDQPAGTVIGQDRAPGLVPQGQTVTLTIAAARTTATVPDGLVGATYDQAVAALNGVGLTNVARAADAYSDVQPVSAVISVNPASGTTVGLSQKITLTVSKGAPPAATPTPTP